VAPSPRAARRDAPCGRETFRPSPPARALAALFGATCAPGAAILCGRAAHGDLLALVGATIWAIPVWFAAAVLIKRIAVDEDGIHSRSLAGARSAPWGAVARLELTRGGFVVVTKAGPISSGWLRPADRERLLRIVLERARLLPSGKPPPAGVRMVYVARTPPGTPHGHTGSACDAVGPGTNGTP
jgi:hypothetical protein